MEKVRQLKTDKDFFNWLLTDVGVLSEHSRHVIINAAKIFFTQNKAKNNAVLPLVSVNEVAVCLKPEHVICCLMQSGLCTEDVYDCEFRQTKR